MHHLCIECAAGQSRDAAEGYEEGPAGVARMGPCDVVIAEPGYFIGSALGSGGSRQAQEEQKDVTKQSVFQKNPS